jgi:hypothetical protein
MVTTVNTGTSPGPSRSYTFSDGQTIPFAVDVPPTPHPLRLIPGRHRLDVVIASVPRKVTVVPHGDIAKQAAGVEELFCVHMSQAVIMTNSNDESRVLACPTCRRIGRLCLMAPDAMTTKTQERQAKQATREHEASRDRG